MKKLFSMMILTVMFFNYSSLVVEAANPKIQLLDESDKEFYRNIIAKKIYTHDEILKIVKTMNKLKIEKSEFEKMMNTQIDLMRKLKKDSEQNILL
ncbi:Uncharacterised protein [Fusobacterium varium]|nr:hypothetical protein [Fusobacterium varium]VEH38875.1 Uncharacterised protein [Fusobacterium varium]